MSNIGGIGGGSAPAPESQSKASNTNADNQDADDFSKALDKKEAEQKKTEGKKEDKNPQELLRSMKDSSEGMDIRADKIQMAGKAEVATVQKTNATDAVDKINKIVDRIMLAEAGSTKEVKVAFNQDFLAGTDVTIRKDGGKIMVEFNTTSADSFNFLSKGEQSLISQLQNKLGDDVSVDIRDMSQQQDGRSKNEYTGEEGENE